MTRVIVVFAFVVPATGIRAQEHATRMDLAAQAVLAHRHHDPVPGDRALGETRIVQPVAMLRATAAHGHLAFRVTANLEGLTIPNGELTLGAWGEGFVDRRHPHTYLHELMVVAHAALGPIRGFLGAGKGFVPFGTDDPMSRPPLGYPVNHHLSQILERALVVVALGSGPFLVEAAAFNGDEPTAPDAWPSLDRFGDSWAVRLTTRPVARLEAQVSHARVRSPEHVGGAGLDHAKWSGSLRWADARRYGLLEWARTSEGGGVFVFHSALAEAGFTLRRHNVYARVERTERPEEERVADFRSVRPLRDNGILGTSRWTLGTIGYRLNMTVAPFVEMTLGRVTKVGGGVFDPSVYYGGRSFASLAVGLRLSHGWETHRMGRYEH